MAIDRQESPYRRGNRYEVMPIPMVPEHCHPIDAGAVQLVVESRRLTDQILDETYPDGTIPEAEVHFDDHGPSLHVCDLEGREHVRFDCFLHEPHYHYIEQANQANVIVRIDEVAVGDPIDFTFTCLDQRLPDMIANAGAIELAEQVRARMDEVRAALPKVRDLMERARPVAQPA